jgi:hypothetical protein
MRVELLTDDDTIVLLDNRLDASGDAWIKEKGIQGLVGATKPRETGTAKPQQHGSYWPSRLTGESRTITMDCVAARGSTVSSAHLIDRISDLAYREVTLKVSDANGGRTLTGFIADDPSTTFLLSMTAFTFTLIIYCPDPFRYGDWIPYPASNGLIRVENTGNMASWPIVRTTDVSRLTLSLGDQMVVWNGSKDPLTLDFESMQPSQGVVTLDDAFAIPPGRSSVPVSVDAGQLTMLVRPCWK